MLFEKRKKKIKVHIVGAGEIGRTLAAQLSQDDCEVTVVDTDAQVVNALSNSLDVYCYRGNGASYAALSCINNIGPGLDLVGPMANFGIYSDWAMVLLSLVMLIGRLEIFPIFLLFSRSAHGK